VERRLDVRLADHMVGTAIQVAGRTAFEYDAAWRGDPTAYPLSLSLPLAASRHEGEPVEAYLWGLLPDNEHILSRLGQRFHVSPGNAFALLGAIGEDCPGAVQFLDPERGGVEGAVTAADHVEWIAESEIADRLRTLRVDPSAMRRAEDVGAFSLAGAQPKTALLCMDGRWAVPSGRIPTTHILKPPGAEFDGFAENEHFCLALARRAGLPASRSEVRWFGDEPAIVVERFDRVMDPRAARSPAALLRVHQEDLCQALGVHPRSKYQNEGGPAPRDIVELLRDYSSDGARDVDRFTDALALNWLIAGTDAHAKNYALLHGAGARVRLAPLYDVVSALPYPDQLSPFKIKLAMKVGSTYRVRDVRARHWKDLAHECGLRPAEVVARVRDLAARLPDLASDVRHDLADEGLTHPVVARLADEIAEHARMCGTRLG
jgi:serine/threonine-protein kinase HipA